MTRGQPAALHAFLSGEAIFSPLAPRVPELLLHRWADTWRGIGDVVVGMQRHGYWLHLTNIEAGTWRATFWHDAMSAAEAFAAAPTPWAAVHRAAREALVRHEAKRPATVAG